MIHFCQQDIKGCVDTLQDVYISYNTNSTIKQQWQHHLSTCLKCIHKLFEILNSGFISEDILNLIYSWEIDRINSINPSNIPLKADKASQTRIATAILSSLRFDNMQIQFLSLMIPLLISRRNTMESVLKALVPYLDASVLNSTVKFIINFISLVKQQYKIDNEHSFSTTAVVDFLIRLLNKIHASENHKLKLNVETIQSKIHFEFKELISMFSSQLSIQQLFCVSRAVCAIYNLTYDYNGLDAIYDGKYTRYCASIYYFNKLLSTDKLLPEFHEDNLNMFNVMEYSKYNIFHSKINSKKQQLDIITTLQSIYLTPLVQPLPGLNNKIYTIHSKLKEAFETTITTFTESEFLECSPFLPITLSFHESTHTLLSCSKFNQPHDLYFEQLLKLDLNHVYVQFSRYNLQYLSKYYLNSPTVSTGEINRICDFKQYFIDAFQLMNNTTDYIQEYLDDLDKSDPLKLHLLHQDSLYLIEFCYSTVIESVLKILHMMCQHGLDLNTEKNIHFIFVLVDFVKKMLTENNNFIQWYFELYDSNYRPDPLPEALKVNLSSFKFDIIDLNDLKSHFTDIGSSLLRIFKFRSPPFENKYIKDLETIFSEFEYNVDDFMVSYYLENPQEDITNKPALATQFNNWNAILDHIDNTNNYYSTVNINEYGNDSNDTGYSEDIPVAITEVNSQAKRFKASNLSSDFHILLLCKALLDLENNNGEYFKMPTQDLLIDVPTGAIPYEQYINIFYPLFVVECFAQINNELANITDHESTFVTNIISNVPLHDNNDYNELEMSLSHGLDIYTDSFVIFQVQHQNGKTNWFHGLILSFCKRNKNISVRIASKYGGIPGKSELLVYNIINLVSMKRELNVLSYLGLDESFDKYLKEMMIYDATMPVSNNYQVYKADIMRHNKEPLLNDSQMNAIARYQSYTKGICILQGPPGTGKSHTIAHGMYHILRTEPNSKFLICAPSNYAVDNLIDALLNVGLINLQTKNWVRLGISKHDRFVEFMKGEFKQQSRPKFIFSTLSKSMLVKQRMDHVIIDEACQATELLCLIPFMKVKPKKGWLVGDHLQLKAYAVSDIAKTHNYDQSLATRFLKNRPDNMPGFQLNSCYRTDLQIAYFNPLFYNNELLFPIFNNPIAELLNVKNLKKFSFFNVVDSQDDIIKNMTSKGSRVEAKRVCEFLVTLDKVFENQNENVDVMILSFYTRQIEYIYDKMVEELNWGSDICGSKIDSKKFVEVKFGNLEVKLGTVDSFQGHEASIVIVSTVYWSEFVDNPFRLNVALSRPKYGLYIFGNYEKLTRTDAESSRPVCKNWYRLLKNLAKKDEIITNQ